MAQGHKLTSLVEIKKTVHKVVDQKLKTCENYIRQIKSTVNERKGELRKEFNSARKNIETQRDHLIA